MCLLTTICRSEDLTVPPLVGCCRWNLHMHIYVTRIVFNHSPCGYCNPLCRAALCVYTVVRGVLNPRTKKDSYTLPMLYITYIYMLCVVFGYSTVSKLSENLQYQLCYHILTIFPFGPAELYGLFGFKFIIIIIMYQL